MKVLFIGCVRFSYELIKTLDENTTADIAGIVSKNQSIINSDHKSLIPFAQERDIPFHDFKNNEQLYNWLLHIDFDVIYCFGWSYLLPLEIIKTAKLGAIGYHPAMLPHNRGRHPIIWALVLGLETTGSTFFFLDEGADSGDILSQEVISIDKTNTAKELYEKLIKEAKKQLIGFTEKLMLGNYQPKIQNHQLANYWRKRNKLDGLIDWRMSNESIYNLVRALSFPYIGAHCLYNQKEVKIWKVQSLKEQAIFQLNNFEPGKVIESNEKKNSVIVKTGDSILEISQHEFETLPKEGEYIL